MSMTKSLFEVLVSGVICSCFATIAAVNSFISVVMRDRWPRLSWYVKCRASPRLGLGKLDGTFCAA